MVEKRIKIQSDHVIIEADLVEQIFGKIQHAYITFLAEQEQILITPVSNQWFVKLYTPHQFLLKSKNLQGDKTLPLRSIMIDHNIHFNHSELYCEVVKELELIKIFLPKN